MPRDRPREIEDHRVVVSRYCAECRRDIRIEDEVNEARDWAAHMARHRRPKRGA